MRIIAHRCRFEGSIYADNTLEAMHSSLEKGFLCELDVSYIKGNYYLGHDEEKNRVEIENIDMPEVFIHMKTPHLPQIKYADCFYLNTDFAAFTLRGRIWVNTGIIIKSSRAILCSPELTSGSPNIDILNHEKNYYGICTDFPEFYKENF